MRDGLSGPIRLSVPVTELVWHRHSSLLVPLMILAVYLLVGLAVAMIFGLDAALVPVLDGVGIVVVLGGVHYAMARGDQVGLCEAALLYRDRIVLLRDGREMSLPWDDVKVVRHGWVGKRYWARYPVQLDCSVHGRDVRLCFYPRMDPEFHQWGLGAPYEALSMISGRSMRAPR